VLRVLNVALEHPSANEVELAALLCEAGFDPFDADRAVIFVPSAFARLVLKRMGMEDFPQTYRVQDLRGIWHERPLADEPWFQAGMSAAVAVEVHGYAAEGCIGPTATREQYEAAIQLSPEISVAVKVLEQSSDLAGAKLRPLIVYQWRLATPTPWWRFWRR